MNDKVTLTKKTPDAKKDASKKATPKPKPAPRGVGGVYELVDGVRVKKETD